MLRNADFKDRYGEYHMSLCNINEIVGFNYIKTLIYTNLVAGINLSIHDKIFYLDNEILCCGYLIIFLFQPDCCIRSFEKAYRDTHVKNHRTFAAILHCTLFWLFSAFFTNIRQLMYTIFDANEIEFVHFVYVL